jgi:hypothetical protein
MVAVGRVRAAHADAWAAEGGDRGVVARRRRPGGDADRAGRRGGRPAILPALATVVLERAFVAEPQVLAHCHAEPGEDVSWLAAPGFSEVPGLLVRVVEEQA